MGESKRWVPLAVVGALVLVGAAGVVFVVMQTSKAESGPGGTRRNSTLEELRSAARAAEATNPELLKTLPAPPPPPRRPVSEGVALLRKHDAHGFMNWARGNLRSTDVVVNTTIVELDKTRSWGDGVCFDGRIVGIQVQSGDDFSDMAGGIIERDDVYARFIAFRHSGVLKGEHALLCGYSAGSLENGPLVIGTFR